MQASSVLRLVLAPLKSDPNRVFRVNQNKTFFRLRSQMRAPWYKPPNNSYPHPDKLHFHMIWSVGSFQGQLVMFHSPKSCFQLQFFKCSFSCGLERGCRNKPRMHFLKNVPRNFKSIRYLAPSQKCKLHHLGKGL